MEWWQFWLLLSAFLRATAPHSMARGALLLLDLLPMREKGVTHIHKNRPNTTNVAHNSQHDQNPSVGTVNLTNIPLQSHVSVV